MQKIFETLRKFTEAKERKWNPETDYSAAGPERDYPKPQPDEEKDEPVKVKPLIRYMNSYVVTPEAYALIMSKYDKSKTPEEYKKEFPRISREVKEAIKDILEKLFEKSHIEVPRDKITFVS